jgi:hypothetical protein
MNWQAGEPISPKAPLTAAAKNCGLSAECMGYTTFVDRQAISIYMDRAGAGYIEAQCPLDVFAANFQRRFGAGINGAYIKKAHANKVFPRDFFLG